MLIIKVKLYKGKLINFDLFKSLKIICDTEFIIYGQKNN